MARHTFRSCPRILFSSLSHAGHGLCYRLVVRNGVPSVLHSSNHGAITIGDRPHATKSQALVKVLCFHVLALTLTVMGKE